MGRLLMVAGLMAAMAAGKAAADTDRYMDCVFETVDAIDAVPEKVAPAEELAIAVFELCRQHREDPAPDAGLEPGLTWKLTLRDWHQHVSTVLGIVERRRAAAG
jgi:hypothetical protein